MDKFRETLIWTTIVYLTLLFIAFIGRQVRLILTDLDKTSVAIILLLIFALIFAIIYHSLGE